jgi:hypothetical protein
VTAIARSHGLLDVITPITRRPRKRNRNSSHSKITLCSRYGLSNY